jgi:hypothetical protein
MRRLWPRSSERRQGPMTMYMQSVRDGATTRGDARVSPELVLVDPQLAAVARSRLPDYPPAALPRSRVRHVTPTHRQVTADELETGRETTSWRLLAGVAAVAMLALLLLDVRVRVGERPASALVVDADVGASKPDAGPSVEPARSSTPSTAGLAGTLSDRRFAWAPVPRASGYHVEFFRGATRVFSQDTRRAELTIPARWKHHGVRRSFRPGTYAWYVWPVISGRRESRAHVQTTVSIPNR